MDGHKPEEFSELIINEAGMPCGYISKSGRAILYGTSIKVFSGPFKKPRFLVQAGIVVPNIEIRSCRPSGRHRYRVIKVFGEKCYYCEKKLKHSEITLDHVIPRALGGSNKWNLVPSCWSCNQDKRNKMPSPELVEEVRNKYKSLTS